MVASILFGTLIHLCQTFALTCSNPSMTSYSLSGSFFAAMEVIKPFLQKFLIMAMELMPEEGNLRNVLLITE